MKYLKHLLVAFFLFCSAVIAKADEGMWLPQLLARLNEKQMKGMGMKISAADCQLWRILHRRTDLFKRTYPDQSSLRI
jgi:hypothetical protein